MMLSTLALAASLYANFLNPPEAAKPWTYWWWINGHVDKATITADLEAMKRLGFGGLLMFDSRGYWDDAEHVVNPKPATPFMSDVWQDHVVFAIREAARLGLKFTMNMSSSGGKLDGPWAVGADAPKRLVYRLYAPGATFETPAFPHYREIAAQEVWYAGEPLAVPSDWQNGGEGEVARSDIRDARSKWISGGAARMRVPAGTPGAHRVLVRFGYTTLPEHEHDVDVLDAKAVAGHFERFQGTLQKRLPGLVGRDKTLSALYSVSWEGSMPSWTGDFPAQFRKFTGGDALAGLPYLAGFTDAGREAFMRKYRRARNDMFRENFYGTMRDLAHARNLDWYSESGGPWNRDKKIFGEADQLQFLGVNDFPQGEFWPVREHGTTKDDGLENANGRYHVRAAVNAAHIYGRNIAAAEAFTHMHRHWSVDPGFLKPLADQAFADGVNRLVWHTFTCSPDAFGAPGAEYFAGSHINRRVTWHGELGPMIRYLGRCQYLLQAGEPVADIALLGGDRTYAHWGRFRDRPADPKAEPHLDVRIPHGYAYDLVNDDALARNPDLLKRYPVVCDLRKPENRGKTVPVKRLRPDCDPLNRSITWCHRRIAGVAEIYFLTGSGNLTGTNGWVTFRARAPYVEMWDPVSGGRRVPQHKVFGDTTGLQLNLREGGSVFILFLQEPSVGADGSKAEPFRDVNRANVSAIVGDWRIRFDYPKGVKAEPPAALVTKGLYDFTEFPKRPDLRDFSGTATYKATLRVAVVPSKGRAQLEIGALATGLAHVCLNGRDCGVVWCRPWSVDVTDALKPGDNALEIRYTNNWFNRLLADCALPESERVTKSTLRYWNEPRTAKDPKRPWHKTPTVYSGFSASDTPQRAGLVGPVRLMIDRDALPKANPCGLGSDTFANWLALGETITFTNALPADATLEGVVTDTSGAEVYRASAAGRAWTWKPARTGFYNVRFASLRDGVRTPVVMNMTAGAWNFHGAKTFMDLLGVFPRDAFAIAVSPAAPRAPKDAPARLGFNVSAHPRAQDLEPTRRAVALLGMNAFLRCHYSRWNEIETKPGVYDWKVTDRMVRYWLDHGYTYETLLLNVFGTPDWLSTRPTNTVSKVWYDRPALYAPRDMEPVRAFFRTFCERYRGIRHLEVWNEPHLPGYSVFWKDSSPEQFVDLLKHAYRGVREADPTINVVMGGIGMRYLPFYERIVPLGAVDWFDTLDTHCGYDMRPFRELERRAGAKSKPYWEGEWHTVLYNCSDPNPPSEEECAFRMLQNFAGLLHTVPTRITGFGLMCGAHAPESAKVYAKVGGIQQVCGLFRSLPMLEPRFAAFALRTATDLFARDVKDLGAWRFGDDGRWYAVAQTSARGNVAFVWTPVTENARGNVPEALRRAGAGKRILDWEGHETSFDAMLPRRMYYLVDPDLAALASGVPTETVGYSAYNFKGYAGDRRVRCGYGAAAKSVPFGKGASFRAELDAEGLRLAVTPPAGEKPVRLGIAADAEGNGLLDDVIEFRVVPGKPLVKPRTPALKGDIPSDYSPANVPLEKSRATFADGAWRISIWRGDLFPFAYSDGRMLPLSLVLETDRGRHAWGGGWGRLVEPGKFGILAASGGGEPCGDLKASRVFGKAKFAVKDGVFSVKALGRLGPAGFTVPVTYVSGSTLAYRGEIRGDFRRIHMGCWCAFGKGRNERHDGPGCGGTARDWQPFSGTIALPKQTVRGALNIFSFDDPGANWEIRNLEIVND